MAKSWRRVFIATVGGIFFGFVCYGIASGGGAKIPLAVALQIISSRALIGFAIGISCLPVHWSLNGLLMGLLFSLPLAFSGLMVPENPEFSKTSMFIWTVLFGMIYGLLIEVLTSKICKTRGCTCR
jgi:hypothetical protein